MDSLEKVTLEGPEKFTYVSSLLSNEDREQLRLVLMNNIDVFTWSHLDMVRINPTMASHKLNVIPADKLVRQKVRRFHSDRHQIIQMEVDNLLRAGFIREVKYPKWLVNVVWFQRNEVRGEYVLITLTSTKHAQKIVFPCRI